MSEAWQADDLISVRSPNIERYKRNFLRQAVCELRFPTLMELGDPKPPSAIVNALRKEYPHLELANEVTLGIGGGANGTNNTHIFRSSKLTWAVSLKQSSLTVETTAYTDFNQMQKRVLQVVDAASKTIDTEFFTRVGLRYVNIIDSETDPTDGWVNADLVAPIRSKAFSGIQEYTGRVMVGAPDGGCLLQHGIRHKQSPVNEKVPVEYIIDIDAYRTDVGIADTAEILHRLNLQAFDVFDWAIGPKAQEYLSSGSPKK